LLPGALTLLLPNPRGRFPLACAPTAPQGQASPKHEPLALGLRVPSLPAQLAPLGAIAEPVMQSSANLSGGPEASRFEDVAESVRAAVDLALDGGALPGMASTILDLRGYEHDGHWTVLREGPVGRTDIELTLGTSA
jgi:L-threonylcarbamoyladenylate synthase